MIKLQELTPQIYYNQSRDFQFIGRLYDLVLNYVKTNADNLYNLPIADNSDEQTLNLLATTLGFKIRRNYNSEQLEAVCAILPKIIKYKGSLRAVILATQAILRASGIKQGLSYETVENNTKVILYVSSYLTNLNLLYDVIDYVLPAGMSFEIIQQLSLMTEATTTIGFSSDVKVNTNIIREKIGGYDSNNNPINYNIIGDGSISISNGRVYQHQATATSEITKEGENK